MPPESVWAEEELTRLPSCVAILLRDVGTEPDARVRLQRVCDVAEMLLRLCVFIRVAEWDGALPDDLARKLVGRAERPTLGDWLWMACALSDEPKADTLVPELAWSVSDVLYPLVTGLRRGEQRRVDERDSVRELRTVLAHGGGLGKRAARELLPHHVPRLENGVRRLAWLTELRLVAHDLNGRPRLLSGPTAAGRDPGEEGLRDVAGLAQPAGQVMAVRGARSLPLYPLHAFGRPEAMGAAPWSQADDPAPLVFFRGEDRWLSLAALDSLWPMSELRGDAVRRFRQLFRLGERRALLREESGGFDREMPDEARRLVGRDRELEEVVMAVDAAASGILWLHGPAGVGKSALLAAVFTHLVTRDHPDELVVAYRFRADDPRATRLQFLRWTIRSLERCSATGVGITSSHVYDDVEDLESRTGQILRGVHPPSRVVFVLDGLDEIARADPGFTDVVGRLAARQTAVVWLCGGRLEAGVQEAFAPGRCTHLFKGDGLGPLTEPAVAEWLIRDAPMSVRDRLIRDGTDERPAPWVRHVAQRSQGLPAYLTLLLDDIRADAIQVDAKLPRGLDEYFSALLQRNHIHDVAGASPVAFAAIALAADPPDERVLVEVLRGCGQLPQATLADHLAIVGGAVARARTMLRRVALDGEYGYAPYHEELAAFLTSTPQLANECARARTGWRAFAEGACRLPDQVVRNRACRTATRQLIALGEFEAAERCLYAPELLIARLAAGRGDVLGDLLRESQEIVAVSSDHARLTAWGGFLADYQHWLGTGGGAAFLQLAVAHADESIVTLEVERWLETASPPFSWFRRVGRSRAIAELGAVRAVDRHGGVVGHLVVAGPFAVSAGDDTLVKLWDLTTGRPVRALDGHARRVTALWADAFGGSVVSASEDGSVIFWDQESGLPAATLDMPGSTTDDAADEEGPPDQATSEPEVPDQSETEPADQMSSVESEERSEHRGVTDIAWAPDGRLVTAERSGALRVWNVSGALGATIGIPWAAGEEPRAHRGGIVAALVTADGSRLVSSGADFRTRVWSLATGALEHDLEGAPSGPEALALTLDGTWLVVGASDGMRIWKMAAGTPVGCLDEAMGAVRVVLAISSSRVVVGGEDGVVRLWDVAGGGSLWEAAGEAGPILCGAFDEARQWLAAGTAGGVIVWEIGLPDAFGCCVAAAPVTAVCFDQSGRLSYGDAEGNVITVELKRRAE